MYLLIYVDDIVITRNSSQFLDSLVLQLGQAFELKDLRALHYFLGLHIHRSFAGLFINQAEYIMDLLTKHNMLTSEPVKTSYIPNIRLVPNEGTLLPDPQVYCSLVGSLHYLILTGPDLSFACIKFVNLCSSLLMYTLML